MTAMDLAAAEHMDRMYRYQRHIYDLTRRHYLLGRDKLIRDLNPPEGGSVLEAGCGTGRNLILAARRYERARFFGFDISAAMLNTAGNNIVSAGLKDRVRLAQSDATRFDPKQTFAVSGFDRVFISFALTMIPPWREALQCAWSCVAPGGSLHIVDFGQQEGLPAWFRALLFAWLRQFSVTPRPEIRMALERLAHVHRAEFRYERLYRGYSYHAVLQRA